MTYASKSLQFNDGNNVKQICLNLSGRDVAADRADPKDAFLIKAEDAVTLQLNFRCP